MKPLPGLFIGLAVIAAGLLWALHPKGADAPHADHLPRFDTAPATLNITLLGSSLSAAMPRAALQDRITACTGRAVTVSKITSGGKTSVWGAGQLDRVKATEPAIVFVEFTINDADLRRRVSLRNSLAAHQSIIDTLRTDLPETQIVLLRLNRAYRGLRTLVRPRQARYDALLPRLSQERQTGYLDLRAQWSAIWAERGYDALPDSLHPTADAITDVTIPALARAIAAMMSDAFACP